MSQRSLPSTRIALVALAFALALPAAGRAQGLSEEPGYDRRRGDYDHFLTRRLEECKTACRRDDRCAAYSYLSGAQECWLKNRVYALQPARGAVTGVKAGGDGPGRPGGGGGRFDNLTEERGYDRRGNDYTRLRVRGLDDCKRSCAREDRCRAYTFDTRSSECWLKDRVNSASSNGAMVTGYKSDPRPVGGGGEAGSPRSRASTAAATTTTRSGPAGSRSAGGPAGARTAAAPTPSCRAPAPAT